jgi:deoxynucleoside triphosphate triphosphohydrolase SAMHD1
MSTKEVFDPIHEFISITPLMQLIINTPEIQRLRELKQLGATYFVFPSATHSRFAHSLGVSHLAGAMMESLQKNQPELEINERDIEITRIAGLIHDIAHGPFSHLYDEYVRHYDEDEHEVRGGKLFVKMIEKYNIPLNGDEVKKIIDMVDPKDGLEMCWQYQIVANKMCQVDVDKLDYIRRDCYHLGIKISDTFSRLVSKVRVVTNASGHHILAWPKKLQFNIFNLFATRYRLHKQVYNHHAVKAHEFIIVDILKRMRTRIGAKTWTLTDSSVMCSLHGETREFLEKLQFRNIPKLVGEKVVKLPNNAYRVEDPHLRQVFDNTIQYVKIGFASGIENPLYQVHYYDKDSKDSGEKANPQNNSFCIPSQFQELIVRMYTTSNIDNEKKQEWILIEKHFALDDKN